jgi:hypothetical protein
MPRIEVIIHLLQEDLMIQYKVKSSDGIHSYLEVVKENSEGYDVVITCVYEDYKKEMHEFLTKQLFQTCIRTGYLTPLDETAQVLASA